MMGRFSFPIAYFALPRLLERKYSLLKRPLKTSIYSYCTPSQKKETEKIVPINSKTVDESLWRGERVTSASHNDTSISVSWNEEGSSQYLHVWLRDNCQCPLCFNASSSSRICRMADLDVDIKPASVNVKGGNLSITWPDGHMSEYSSEWLAVRSFNVEDIERRRKYLSPGRVQHWGRELQDNLPKYDFHEFMTSEEMLYRWLNSLETLGIALLTNTPCSYGQVAKMGKRVEFLRGTHFGEIWQVTAKPDPNDLAYTTVPLGLHSDLAYYNYQPGLQIFHCVKQVSSEGGENQFSDSFRAAYILKERHPDMFEALTTIHVDHRMMGHDKSTDTRYYKKNSLPIIGCDMNGNVNKVNFSDQTRDSMLQLPIEDVFKVYRAMKTFYDLMYEQDNHIKYKLQPGDTISFHNHRVLHARTGFKFSQGGERVLEGAYMDWDELNSRRRVLMLQLGLIQQETTNHQT